MLRAPASLKRQASSSRGKELPPQRPLCRAFRASRRPSVLQATQAPLQGERAGSLGGLAQERSLLHAIRPPLLHVQPGAAAGGVGAGSAPVVVHQFSLQYRICQPSTPALTSITGS